MKLIFTFKLLSPGVFGGDKTLLAFNVKTYAINHYISKDQIIRMKTFNPEWKPIDIKKIG